MPFDDIYETTNNNLTNLEQEITNINLIFTTTNFEIPSYVYGFLITASGFLSKITAIQQDLTRQLAELTQSGNYNENDPKQKVQMEQLSQRLLKIDTRLNEISTTILENETFITQVSPPDNKRQRDIFYVEDAINTLKSLTESKVHMNLINNNLAIIRGSTPKDEITPLVNALNAAIRIAEAQQSNNNASARQDKTREGSVLSSIIPSFLRSSSRPDSTRKGSISSNVTRPTRADSAPSIRTDNTTLLSSTSKQKKPVKNYADLIEKRFKEIEKSNMGMAKKTEQPGNQNTQERISQQQADYIFNEVLKKLANESKNKIDIFDGVRQVLEKNPNVYSNLVARHKDKEHFQAFQRFLTDIKRDSPLLKLSGQETSASTPASPSLDTSQTATPALSSSITTSVSRKATQPASTTQSILSASSLSAVTARSNLESEPPSDAASTAPSTASEPLSVRSQSNASFRSATSKLSLAADNSAAEADVDENKIKILELQLMQKRAEYGEKYLAFKNEFLDDKTLSPEEKSARSKQLDDSFRPEERRLSQDATKLNSKDESNKSLVERAKQSESLIASTDQLLEKLETFRATFSEANSERASELSNRLLNKQLELSKAFAILNKELTGGKKLDYSKDSSKLLEIANVLKPFRDESNAIRQEQRAIFEAIQANNNVTDSSHIARYTALIERTEAITAKLQTTRIELAINRINDSLVNISDSIAADPDAAANPAFLQKFAETQNALAQLSSDFDSVRQSLQNREVTASLEKQISNLKELSGNVKALISNAAPENIESSTPPPTAGFTHKDLDNLLRPNTEEEKQVKAAIADADSLLEGSPTPNNTSERIPLDLDEVDKLIADAERKQRLVPDSPPPQIRDLGNMPAPMPIATPLPQQPPQPSATGLDFETINQQLDELTRLVAEGNAASPTDTTASLPPPNFRYPPPPVPISAPESNADRNPDKEVKLGKSPKNLDDLVMPQLEEAFDLDTNKVIGTMPLTNVASNAANPTDTTASLPVLPITAPDVSAAPAEQTTPVLLPIPDFLPPPPEPPREASAEANGPLLVPILSSSPVIAISSTPVAEIKLSELPQPTLTESIDSGSTQLTPQYFIAYQDLEEFIKQLKIWQDSSETSQKSEVKQQIMQAIHEINDHIDALKKVYIEKGETNIIHKDVDPLKDLLAEKRKLFNPPAQIETSRRDDSSGKTLAAAISSTPVAEIKLSELPQPTLTESIDSGSTQLTPQYFIAYQDLEEFIKQLKIWQDSSETSQKSEVKQQIMQAIHEINDHIDALKKVYIEKGETNIIHKDVDPLKDLLAEKRKLFNPEAATQSDTTSAESAQMSNGVPITELDSTSATPVIGTQGNTGTTATAAASTLPVVSQPIVLEPIQSSSRLPSVRGTAQALSENQTSKIEKEISKKLAPRFFIFPRLNSEKARIITSEIITAASISFITQTPEQLARYKILDNYLKDNPKVAEKCQRSIQPATGFSTYREQHALEPTPRQVESTRKEIVASLTSIQNDEGKAKQIATFTTRAAKGEMGYNKEAVFKICDEYFKEHPAVQAAYQSRVTNPDKEKSFEEYRESHKSEPTPKQEKEVRKNVLEKFTSTFLNPKSTEEKANEVVSYMRQIERYPAADRSAIRKTLEDYLDSNPKVKHAVCQRFNISTTLTTPSAKIVLDTIDTKFIGDKANDIILYIHRHISTINNLTLKMSSPSRSETVDKDKINEEINQIREKLSKDIENDLNNNPQLRDHLYKMYGLDTGDAAPSTNILIEKIRTWTPPAPKLPSGREAAEILKMTAHNLDSRARERAAVPTAPSRGPVSTPSSPREATVVANSASTIPANLPSSTQEDSEEKLKKLFEVQPGNNLTILKEAYFKAKKEYLDTKQKVSDFIKTNENETKDLSDLSQNIHNDLELRSQNVFRGSEKEFRTWTQQLIDATKQLNEELSRFQANTKVAASPIQVPPAGNIDTSSNAGQGNLPTTSRDQGAEIVAGSQPGSPGQKQPAESGSNLSANSELPLAKASSSSSVSDEEPPAPNQPNREPELLQPINKKPTTAPSPGSDNPHIDIDTTDEAVLDIVIGNITDEKAIDALEKSLEKDPKSLHDQLASTGRQLAAAKNVLVASDGKTQDQTKRELEAEKMLAEVNAATPPAPPPSTAAPLTQLPVTIVSPAPSRGSQFVAMPQITADAPPPTEDMKNDALRRGSGAVTPQSPHPATMPPVEPPVSTAKTEEKGFLATARTWMGGLFSNESKARNATANQAQTSTMHRTSILLAQGNKQVAEQGLTTARNTVHHEIQQKDKQRTGLRSSTDNVAQQMNLTEKQIKQGTPSPPSTASTSSSTGQGVDADKNEASRIGIGTPGK